MFYQCNILYFDNVIVIVTPHLICFKNSFISYNITCQCHNAARAKRIDLPEGTFKPCTIERQFFK